MLYSMLRGLPQSPQILIGELFSGLDKCRRLRHFGHGAADCGLGLDQIGFLDFIEHPAVDGMQHQHLFGGAAR